VLEDEANELVLSVVSLWEIALKARAGKLSLPERSEFFREHMRQLGIGRVLSVEARHVFGLFELPHHHRDPFDRLLAAQSRTERLPLVASDRMFRRYPIEVLW